MNLRQFKKKLRSLYTNWEKHRQDLWGGSDILLVSTPPTNYSSSITHKFYIWLLGYAFADTIAIFTPKEIHFICNKQKGSLLKQFTDSTIEAVGVQLVVHEKAKGDDGVKIVDEILRRLRPTAMKIENKDNPFVVGYVGGECPYSKVLWGLSRKKKVDEVGVVDIKDGVSKFASLARVSACEEKEILGEKTEESVFWGVKHSIVCESESIDIYFQELSKEAEEKILLAEERRLVDDITCRRRSKKEEALESEKNREIDELGSSFDGPDEWILV